MAETNEPETGNEVRAQAFALECLDCDASYRVPQEVAQVLDELGAWPWDGQRSGHLCPDCGERAFESAQAEETARQERLREAGYVHPGEKATSAEIADGLIDEYAAMAGQRLRLRNFLEGAFGEPVEEGREIETAMGRIIALCKQLEPHLSAAAVMPLGKPAEA